MCWSISVEDLEAKFAVQDKKMQILEKDIAMLKLVELAKDAINRYIDSAQSQLTEVCKSITDANRKQMAEFFKEMSTSFKLLIANEKTGSSSKDGAMAID